MIIYSLTLNKGGLRRVTESMLDIFEYLPEDFPLKIVYFANSPIEGLDPDKYIYQFYEDGNPDLLTDEGMKRVHNELENKLKNIKVERVIFEASIYRFWKRFDFKFSIDVHILERPLYQSLIKNPQSKRIDDISPDPFYSLLVRMGLVSMKLEAEAFSRSDHLIANSKTTMKDLHNFYDKEIENKRVDFVPVTTELTNNSTESFISLKYKEEPSYLYYGRFHPQKGLHFLFNQDWNFGKLTIKGFDEKLFESDRLKKLTDRNIHFSPWESNKSSLEKLIEESDFIIFPSIYEPYGLALTECLMLGKICICHDNGSGHNEQIDHGKNGFLIDFNKENWIDEVKSISKLDIAKLKKISESAKVSIRYNKEQRRDAFINMLKSII